MTAATDDTDARTPPRRASLALVPGPAASLVAYVAAAAFVVAAVWYGLTARFITVAKPPAFNPNTPPRRRAPPLVQLVCDHPPAGAPRHRDRRRRLPVPAPAHRFIGDLLGRHRTLARIGSVSMPAGALLWVAGNVLQLGGHRAVGLMATHGHPVETVNSILFTVDTITNAFELAAFAVLGVALLALTGAAVGDPTGNRAVWRAWCGYSLLLGVVLLGLSGAYAAADGNLVELLVTGGALLLPGWLVWTGRLLRNATASQTRTQV